MGLMNLASQVTLQFYFQKPLLKPVVGLGVGSKDYPKI